MKLSEMISGERDLEFDAYGFILSRGTLDKWIDKAVQLEAENERLREFAQDMIRRAGYDISVDEALGGE